MTAANANLQERLRAVLRLEQARGCSDRTVIGGLDALLKNLLVQSAGGPGQRPIEDAVRALGPHRYAGLDETQRRAWIERALHLLDGHAAPASALGRANGRRESESRAAGAPDLPPTARPGTSPRTKSPRSAPRESAPPASLRGKGAPSTREAASRARPARPAREVTPDSPVTVLPGIGSNRAELLGRLGIHTVCDLLFHFPHRHADFSRVVRISDLQVGADQTVVARVWSAAAVKIGQLPRKSTELIVGDETGNLQVVFFNNPYPAASLRINQRITLSGRVTVYQGQRQLQNPEWEIIEEGGELDQAVHTGRLVPVYPLTHGIQNRSLRQYARAAIDLALEQIEETLPESLRAERGLLDIRSAIKQAHYPESLEAVEAARRRLAYDEFLALQLAVQARRTRRTNTLRTRPLPLDDGLLQAFTTSLPFPLTGAQSRAVAALLDDLRLDTPMARLLQGDVGSGKTVVAAAALLAALANGSQAVLMAPTEILAEQHFQTLWRLFGSEAGDDEAIVSCRPSWFERPVRLALLRGSLRARAKRAVQDAIAFGEVDIAVGTQALIQGTVEFERLGLTIVDEQHRFGVQQRSALLEKGENVHLLVMTATPIPRTLALSIYGDLDVSVIDEMPPGRKPIKTRVVRPEHRDHAYRFVRDQVERGFQAFVICPLVEESEAIEVRAATEEYERLRREVFPDLSLALLHGRMAPTDKDAVMRDFRDGSAKILVSTAVVEVGIDIPKATVIMIEGAERFGLAQLHQFRGRVGRSGDQSYCLLLSDSPSIESQERLQLLAEIGDGLKLAEEDLKLRGPGDVFGTRQSGLPELQHARIGDLPILESARSDALALLARDPLLSAPEFESLKRRVAALVFRAGEAS